MSKKEMAVGLVAILAAIVMGQFGYGIISAVLVLLLFALWAVFKVLGAARTVAMGAIDGAMGPAADEEKRRRTVSAIVTLCFVGVLAAWWGMSSGPKKEEEKAPEKPAAVSQAVPEKVADASGQDCPCGTGKVCVGPAGGRYCMTDAGRKKYK